MTKRTPEITHGIFCEFARGEGNGQTTLLGIWGESCRFTAPLPLLLPALAFYTYIRNPDGVPYRLRIEVNIPGAKEPTVFNIPNVTPQPGQDCQNFNINMPNAKIEALGDIVAKVSMEMIPPMKVPVEREFRMAFLRP